MFSHSVIFSRLNVLFHVRLVGFQVGPDISPKGGMMQIVCEQNGIVLIPVFLTEIVTERILARTGFAVTGISKLALLLHLALSIFAVLTDFLNKRLP